MKAFDRIVRTIIILVILVFLYLTFRPLLLPIDFNVSSVDAETMETDIVEVNNSCEEGAKKPGLFNVDMICQNGKWVPDENAGYLTIKFKSFGSKCMVFYNAGWPNGGSGFVEESFVGKEIGDCPKPPGPYPVKYVQWTYFYKAIDTETKRPFYSDPYLDEETWKTMEKGVIYRCKKGAWELNFLAFCKEIPLDQ